MQETVVVDHVVIEVGWPLIVGVAAGVVLLLLIVVVWTRRRR